jgi:hypothetical protein
MYLPVPFPPTHHQHRLDRMTGRVRVKLGSHGGHRQWRHWINRDSRRQSPRIPWVRNGRGLFRVVVADVVVSELLNVMFLYKIALMYRNDNIFCELLDLDL